MNLFEEGPLLPVNDRIAASIRKGLNEAGIYTVHLLGSPGAGKTSLLEALLATPYPDDRRCFAVIAADPATDEDAGRMEALEVRVKQINTNGARHLDAGMMERVLDDMDLRDVRVLFIENVGNLVCTGPFRLGEDLRIVVLSVTEGNGKVVKYPRIFPDADAVVCNKIDLLHRTNFDLGKLSADLRGIVPKAEVFELSAKTGEGLVPFAQWVGERKTARFAG